MIQQRADVAQLVEQPIRNRQVIGSSPIVGSILFVFSSQSAPAPEFVTSRNNSFATDSSRARKFSRERLRTPTRSFHACGRDLTRLASDSKRFVGLWTLSEFDHWIARSFFRLSLNHASARSGTSPSTLESTYQTNLRLTICSRLCGSIACRDCYRFSLRCRDRYAVDQGTRVPLPR